MTDIVERLRDRGRYPEYGWAAGLIDDLREAAAEIERLRQHIDAPEPDERREALLDGLWRALEEVEYLGLDATWISNAHLELSALYHEIERLRSIVRLHTLSFKATGNPTPRIIKQIKEIRAAAGTNSVSKIVALIERGRREQ